MNSLGPSILITGANRGLGFALIQELCKLPSIEYIFACCRNPDKADELYNFAKNSYIKKIYILQLDIENEDHLKEAVKDVEKILNGKGLNVIIHNAALLTTNGAGLKNPDRQILLQHMSINIVAPICITSAFLPFLYKDSTIDKPSLVINISSKFGSIKNATRFGPAKGNIAYGITKAGLNQYTRYLSIEKEENQNHIISISLHPGWLRTDMGTSAAPLSVDEGAHAIIETLQKLTMKDNGRFIDRNGKDMDF